MAIRYIDQHGIAHKAVPQSIGTTFAWCYLLFKSVHLRQAHTDEDAPEATCLWCVADRERIR